jgi:adenosine kinase
MLAMVRQILTWCCLTIGRMGNLMGTLKVGRPGTQNQRFDYDEFNEQFKQQFGYSL